MSRHNATNLSKPCHSFLDKGNGSAGGGGGVLLRNASRTSLAAQGSHAAEYFKRARPEPEIPYPRQASSPLLIAMPKRSRTGSPSPGNARATVIDEVVSLIESTPPKALRSFLIGRLSTAPPELGSLLQCIFDGLSPPPPRHCARCHKSYLEEDNYERACGCSSQHSGKMIS